MVAINSPEIILQTQAITKNYDGLCAVNNVDLDCYNNEIHGLIGPNGAGKTSFVSLISGRILPSSGKILFCGKDITQKPAFERVKLGIAYSFQITSVFAQLSVFENIALPVQRRLEFDHNFSEKLCHQRTMAILEKFGLQNRASQSAGLLSYGHQRLCEIAMALALEPKLLICDEPTQGLADKEIDDFINLLRHEKTCRSILLIDHNMEFLMDCAERISVLNLGSLLATGTPKEIQSNDAVHHAYLGG